MLLSTLFVVGVPLLYLSHSCCSRVVALRRHVRYNILEIMALFAVLSNSAIVAFTGNYTEHYTWVVRVWIFVTMAGGIMGVKMLIAAIVPDEPSEVTVQLQRAQYLTDKFFNDIVDEDDSELSQTVASSVDYCVKATDDDPL